MIPVVDAYNINEYVNSAIYPRDDVVDVWVSSTPKYGDCDDYAMSKRQKLLDLGYRNEDIRLVVVKYGYGTHLLVSVNTEQGWYVFDNMPPYFYKFSYGQSILIDGHWRQTNDKNGNIVPSPQGWVGYCSLNKSDIDCR